MAHSDIRIKDIQIDFSTETFRTPLNLSTGSIFGCVYASVTVKVETRAGKSAYGNGGIFLSDLWSFPSQAVSHIEKEDCMKSIVHQLSSLLRDVDAYYDPFQISQMIEQHIPRILQNTAVERGCPVEIPLLVGIVCWSPFDAAIHDAWGRAEDKSCYDMYNRDHLNQDLSAYLGTKWSGIYPEQFLNRVEMPTKVWVQHVVGVNDPLTRFDLADRTLPDDSLPVSLSDWIEVEQIRRFKLKLHGTDVRSNLEFIQDVYRVSSEKLEMLGISPGDMKISLDPNEAFLSPDPIEELLQRLNSEHPSCFQALEYLEQPTPRDLSRNACHLDKVGALKPVIMDESLDNISKLDNVESLGWSGVALKTCKGQSAAILSYCYAKRNNWFVTVQDLTNAGYAFVHSANLYSHIFSSTDSLEFNSRQFTPFSFPKVKETFPDLFNVVDGKISPSQVGHIGLY